MKKHMIFLLVLTVAAVIGAQDRGDGFAEEPVIQIALLLDTSNSMDGLINQAKSQLWKIVSHSSRESRNGRRARLEVALYEYGNDNLSLLSGYVRQIVPFTTDLDYLSQTLFELSTNGGSEYCGKVIQSAYRDLDWDRRPDTLRLLFIAGNEPFDQGPVNYARSVQQAARMDIIVNTIFCGDYEEGRYTQWEQGALLGNGTYMNINSDYQHSYIRAPQDDRIEELNRRLNGTYLGYGTEGREREAMQEAQDSNAMSLGRGSLLDRAKVKSSSSYSNSEWDLVDAYAAGEPVLESVPEAALPAEMSGMDKKEREEYVQAKQEERKEIQDEIARLSAERESYIAEQTAQESEESTLDSAIINAIESSAREKGFEGALE